LSWVNFHIYVEKKQLRDLHIILVVVHSSHNKKFLQIAKLITSESKVETGWLNATPIALFSFVYT
jgi:hypothetical protein